MKNKITSEKVIKAYVKNVSYVKKYKSRSLKFLNVTTFSECR